MYVLWKLDAIGHGAVTQITEPRLNTVLASVVAYLLQETNKSATCMIGAKSRFRAVWRRNKTHHFAAGPGCRSIDAYSISHLTNQPGPFCYLRRKTRSLSPLRALHMDRFTSRDLDRGRRMTRRSCLWQSKLSRVIFYSEILSVFNVW
jgi:hypothetical protein